MGTGFRDLPGQQAARTEAQPSPVPDLTCGASPGAGPANAAGVCHKHTLGRGLVARGAHVRAHTHTHTYTGTHMSGSVHRSPRRRGLSPGADREAGVYPSTRGEERGRVGVAAAKTKPPSVFRAGK